MKPEKNEIEGDEGLSVLLCVREYEARLSRYFSAVFWLSIFLAIFVVLFLADAVIIGKQHILALRACEEISFVCRHCAKSGNDNEPGFGKGFDFRDGKMCDGVPIGAADSPTERLRLVFDRSAASDKPCQCVYCIYGDELSVGACEALKAYFDIHFPLFASPPPESGVGFRQALCGKHCYAYSQSVAACGLAKILREKFFGKQARKPPCGQEQSTGEAVSSGEVEKTR